MTISAQPARLSTLAVFRNRNFTRLWLAQLISVAGSTISWLAAALLIYRATGSALSVSLVLVISALPGLLVGPVAGVFVDRFDRKQIMIAADLIRAALICVIPFLFSYGAIWLYILMLLIGAIGQFFDPAHASVLPEVASDEELAAANSLMAISSQGIWALGFALAGLVASQLAIEWAFYLDGISFLISAACIAGVHGGRAGRAERTTIASIARDMREGAHFLATTPSLRSLFLVGVPLFASLGLLNALLLPFSLRILHASELEYTMIEALCSVGFIVGSLIMTCLIDRLHVGQWLVLSYSAMGLGYFVFALSPNVPAAMLALATYGLISVPAVIARQLVLQRNTPDAVRGRVSSTFFITRDLLMAAGMALAGLADLVDVRVPFIAAALLVLAAGALVLVMPGLRLPAAEWRQALRQLRGAPSLPGLGLGRTATAADIESLAAHLPLLGGLGRRERQALATEMSVYVVPDGAAIVRAGDAGDSAFFLLDGCAIARCRDGEQYHTLETLRAGNFFGEIAALTGLPRTADVVAEQGVTVLRVPLAALRQLIGEPRMRYYLFSRLVARMARTDLIDLPRAVPYGGYAPRLALATSAFAATRLQPLVDETCG